MPRVVAVVLNWDRRDDTRACLASLAASAPAPEVVVVDNGSTECPPEDLVRGFDAAFPRLELVANATNEGYARGMNLGLARALDAGAEHVWILNNDVTVHPDAGRFLADALDARPDAAVAGPAVYDARSPELLSNVGGGLSLARGRTWHLHEGERAPPFAGPREVAFVEGSAMMLRATDARAQGGFDPGYGTYWEDVDWCLTARGRGRRAIVVPEARVWHRVSSSTAVASPYALYHRARNRFRCLRRHGTGAERLVAGLAALADLPRDLYHTRRAGGAPASTAWLRGTVDGLLGRGLGAAPRPKQRGL